MGRSREQEKIRELVSAYLDGELPPDDASYVGRRIQEDPAYRKVYASYRGIRMDLRALARPEVPPAVSQAIRARAAVIQPRRPVLNIRQRVARITAAAATLAATFAAILTGGFGLQDHFSHATPGNAPSNVVIVADKSATTATILNPNIRFDEPAQIRFTRPMNEQTVKTSVIFTPGVAVSNLQYDKDQFVLSTKPKTLIPQTRYTVTIPNGLKDADGNDVSPGSFGFFVNNISSPIANQPTAPAATEVATPTPLAIAAVPTSIATAVPVPAVEATATNEPAPPAETPAPAEAPAASTATTKPAAPPKPANTQAPVQRPVGTTIAVGEPTAVPTVAPTATAAPTAAPTATAVPTVVPTPTTPAIPVADKFKGAYAATANRLGSPTGPATNVGASQLFFQNGFMLYADGQPIYVFYTGDRTYGTYPNPGNSGAGSEGGAAPGGLYKPARAFGVVWTAQKLQGRLGYATAPNETGGAGSVQTFENGTILSVGSDVYVLIKGSWQPFSG